MPERYAKYHALGNDYLVLDPQSFSIPLTPQKIQRICHRNFGLGSDGILYGPQPSTEDIPAVSIFNPDGSEAEKSGNGIRIFAKYLWDHGYATSDSLDLHTKGGKVSVHRNDAQATNLTVAMGKLTVHEKQRLSLDEGRYVVDVDGASMGNLDGDVIEEVQDISEALAREWGPLIENSPYFPHRTNVQFVKVLDRDNIQIEIWERGAGYTLASGSSSCAAAGVCYNLGLCNDNITVHMPGGKLQIQVQKDLEMIMTGDVSSVATGQFTAPFIDQLLQLE